MCLEGSTTIFFQQCEITGFIQKNLQVRVQKDIFNIVMKAREENTADKYTNASSRR